MRRRLLGLVGIVLLASCTESTPTGTRPPGVNRIRSVITAAPTLDQNIQDIIGFWPNKISKDLLAKWNEITKKVAESQTKPKALDDAKKHLAKLIKQILKTTHDMNAPEPPDTRSAAAARLIYYMILYVYGGPDTTPPDFVPGADDAIGLLTRGGSLTLITPSGHAGVHFDKGSVDEDRLIVIRENPNQYPGNCSGPLDTLLCQYPLFYFVESFPDGPLLKLGKVEICHPEVGANRGPPNVNTHLRFHIAHTKPDSPANYNPDGEINGNIEILPVISQTFVPLCENVIYEPDEELGGNFLQRGMHLARALASRVGRLLSPRSAYAVDQGGGGSFLDFSPFNVVDPGVED